jgi:hypothetical protein
MREAQSNRQVRGKLTGTLRPVGVLSNVLPFVAVTAWLAAFPAPTPDGAPADSQAAADKLATKIATLAKPHPSASGRLESITITEAEANSYLRLRGHAFLPAAVHDPELHIQPDQVAASAEVDFNQLEQVGNQTEDWGTKLVAMVFRGKQRVQATGKLETGHGQGKLTLTSLTVGATALPAGFVNFLVQSYMEKRYGIDLSKPFSLPPNVTHIELASGRATLHRNTLSRR